MTTTQLIENALKVVMVGDSNVGKSQLSLRFCKKRFTSDSQSTVGIEFATRSITLNDYLIKAQIWDTAGQERFESMTKAYFRNAVGALLVYDVTNRISFEHMKNKWLVQLREFGHEDMFIIIIGNKSDMENRRQITIAEAAEFAESCGLDYIETSARNGDNVEIAFRRVIMSVACHLPGIKETIRKQQLPKGWFFLIDKEKYLNYWTGDIVANKPESEALTGLIVNSRAHSVEDITFRDSATSISASSHNRTVSTNNNNSNNNNRNSKVKNNQSVDLHRENPEKSRNCLGSCSIL